MPKKKESRTKPLFVRVTKANDAWVKSQMVRLGYKSRSGKSEFVDQLISEARRGR
jgi:hypothetical protein